MLIYLAVLIMTRGSSSLTVEIWNEIGWHVPLFRNQWQWREGIEKLKVLNLNISHGKKSKVTRNIYDGRRRTSLVKLELQCLPFLWASRLFVVCNLSSFSFLVIIDHNQCGLSSIWIRDIICLSSPGKNKANPQQVSDSDLGAGLDSHWVNILEVIYIYTYTYIYNIQSGIFPQKTSKNMYVY